MDPAILVRTAALVHLLDAILCRVIADHSGRQKLFWTIAGLLFGIWALGTLFLLPAKKTDSERFTDAQSAIGRNQLSSIDPDQ